MFDTGIDSTGLVELGRKLAGADARISSDDELAETTIAVEQLRSLVEATSAHLLAELDARGTCDERFGIATPRWVASVAGVAPAGVRQRLKVGRVLRNHLDVIDGVVSVGPAGLDLAGADVDGFEADRVEGVYGARGLSFDHAKVLADAINPRVEQALAEFQDEIVDVAQGATFERFRAEVRGIVELLDADGPEPDDIGVNKLHISAGMHGLTHLDGTFGADVGLTISSAVDAKADELFGRFTRDRETASELDVPGRSTLRALALAELVRIAAGVAPGSGSAPRAEVTLVAHNHEVTDAEGNPLPRAAVGVWGCDPAVWAVVVDEMGLPIEMGHRRRIATIAQRKAIVVRDGGCVFPGCDAPISWCDMHHVDHWDNGGATDVANLVATCRHHHGVAHRDGWSLELTEDQHVLWRSPSGERFWGQRHGRQYRPPGPSG